MEQRTVKRIFYNTIKYKHKGLYYKVLATYIFWIYYFKSEEKWARLLWTCCER